MTRFALVTGASSGIGRALALRLAQDGVHVIVAARREHALRSLVSEITAQGGEATAEVLDVSQADRTVERLRAIDRSIGGIDLVIANAGVGPRRDQESYAWEALADACRTNFTGAVATLTAVLPQMVQRGRGHLVGISSLASFGPLPQSAAYCAPKAGLSMLLDCLRLDVRAHGIKVTAVHVGFVQTPMTAEISHPMPQLLTVERAADYIVKRLPDGPATIDFPQPLASLTRAMGRLPRPLRDVLHSGLARVR
ncbi:MAG: SDR family NAD(P)-dependent oxidoreductase [Deltaproteobacteria bacterium]|nr:SDR family NAD(P)-dependent oxidoreductase [Deltaproteobacteria bacterium]